MTVPTARKPFFRRRKTCPFSGPDAIAIDYKDVKLLQKFTTERGKLSPVALQLFPKRNNVNWLKPSSAHAFYP